MTTTGTTARLLDLGEAWTLSGSVELRPEPFGALAYDFHTRRLSFLKSRRLVDVVRALGSRDDVAGALDDCGVAAPERPAYLAALGALADGGLIQRRADHSQEDRTP
ncbi:mycofactocin biosynthesis chaperone MftB [Nocardioides iriomotensis]|uniref:Mycofactocin biosynthesis chaperone MftB n=1 Tax=Nocardioides iriomotensis TaxID=715784 RepID=A0A4Q5J6J8_9ACTN|nr:mycofactocin biosynthesis chaperone MftB [Nocardioides iriomotensis]RYU13488.1 mycofactocin biosynthesis chaperone MftB [Nocardioides iriomotensis]